MATSNNNDPQSSSLSVTNELLYSNENCLLHVPSVQIDMNALTSALDMDNTAEEDSNSVTVYQQLTVPVTTSNGKFDKFNGFMRQDAWIFPLLFVINSMKPLMVK